MSVRTNTVPEKHLHSNFHREVAARAARDPGRSIKRTDRRGHRTIDDPVHPHAAAGAGPHVLLIFYVVNSAQLFKAYCAIQMFLAEVPEVVTGHDRVYPLASCARKGNRQADQ